MLDDGSSGSWGRTCEDVADDNCWFRRHVCLASMRRNWSFHNLISLCRVLSRRKH